MSFYAIKVYILGYFAASLKLIVTIIITSTNIHLGNNYILIVNALNIEFYNFFEIFTSPKVSSLQL